MKPFNEDIGDIMEKTLQLHSSSLSFDSVWSGYRKQTKRKKLITIPATAFIILITFVTMGFTGVVMTRNIDETDYPFVDDPVVAGKWEAVDLVKNPDDFIPGQKSYRGDLYLNALAFIKDGKMLSAANGVILAPSSFTWTEGIVICKNDKTAGSYEIKDFDGSSYMFFEWKNGDYIYFHRKPWFYVLKKVDSNDYSGFQPKRVIEDNIDYDFVDDERMTGDWQSVDSVDDIDDFHPGRMRLPRDLFLTGLSFHAGGEMAMITAENGEISHPLITWTRGLVLNKFNKTASRCEIREIDGATYMFYEWKSGDYFYRGMKPPYFVLKKMD